MPQGKSILISPLDWGLGHTTRIIPVIKELITQGHNVTIACNQEQQNFLSNYMNLQFILFEGYNVNYSKSLSMGLKMILESPKILKRIKDEETEVATILANQSFDIIISDNRYGFRNNKCQNIFICHQLNIQAPFGVKQAINNIHNKMLNRFDKIWIPDSPSQNLSGELSTTHPRLNTEFIGPLSHLRKLECEKKFEITALISGTEPLRTEFEKKIISLLNNYEGRCAIIGGKDHKHLTTNQNISYFNTLSGEELSLALSQSKKVICRSGYSSIMDLSHLQIPTFLVPTKGQTEQEYLAKHLNSKYKIPYSTESLLNLNSLKGRFEIIPNQASTSHTPQL